MADEKKPSVTFLGIPVKIPLSGILGVALIGFLWMPTFGTSTGAVISAVTFAVLLYVCIFIHELAHALTARWTGNDVQGITLWILGGFTVYERNRITPGREAFIAGSGPITTFAIAAILQGVILATSSFLPVSVLLVAEALVYTNVLLGIVNSVPALPLDGGGVVRAAIWGLTGNEHRGTQVAAWSGRVIAILLVVVPLALAAVPDSPVSLWFVFIMAIFGVFMWGGATMALRRSAVDAKLPLLSARSLTRRAVPVSPDDSVAIVVDKQQQAHAGASVLITDQGQPVGIISDAAIAATPAERRPWVTARSVAVSIDPASGIPVDLTGHDLISALQAARSPAVLVRDAQGAIFGVLLISDVEQALT